MITSHYMCALLSNYTIPAGVMIETMGAEYFLFPLWISSRILSTQEEIKNDPGLQLPLSPAIGGVLVYSLCCEDREYLDTIVGIDMS